MRITLDINKTAGQNAATYYERAKKSKKKLEGAKKALEHSRKKLGQLMQDKENLEKAAAEKKEKKREKKWFEKFRWFVSSEGFLCIGGRDATTNEIVVKKHTDSHDIIFHTDMAGSPFFVIKTEGKTPSESTMNEVAQATASFSRAWRMGLSVLEVFHVKPEQVSKQTKAGEYMGKGSFMIFGKTNYIPANLGLAIGADEEGKVMCASEQSVKAHCKIVILLTQGKDKTSDVAKKVAHKIKSDLDETIAAMPSGGIKIKS